MTKIWLYGLACIGAMALMGCQESTAPAAAPEVREDPAMRTVVPLVRSLGPEALSKPIVLEFDVPAFSEDADLATSAIIIGVRVADKDMGVAADKAHRLRMARIAANVHLYRLEDGTTQSQDLMRYKRTGMGESHVVLLDVSGHAPGLDAAGADYPSLQVAGLMEPGVEYREVKWAHKYQMMPGRYRLDIRIDDHDDALKREGAELLVAFPHRAK